MERKVFVNSSGKYLLCERIDEKEDLYCLGDVNSGIDKNKVQSLIKKNVMLWNENCKNCWSCRLCKACNANYSSISYEGEYCRNMRKTIEKEFQNYLALVRNDERYVYIFDTVTVD